MWVYISKDDAFTVKVGHHTTELSENAQGLDRWEGSFKEILPVLIVIWRLTLDEEKTLSQSWTVIELRLFCKIQQIWVL